MSPDAPPFGIAPQRTPVEFDPATGGLRIGPYERRVENPAEPNQVYGAYLSLLYAVRGAQPGERLPLRTADLEALLLIVGDDPDTIEQRLVGLMGCTAEEASALGKLLLRHRKMTATLGIAATLSLGAAGVVTTVSDDSPAPAPAAAQSVAAPAAAQPIPISGTTQAAPATPVQVGPPTTPVVIAAPAPAVEPVAVVAPAAEVAAPDAPAAPAAPIAPVVEAPAVEAPVAAPVVAPAPVEVPAEPAYALPTYAVPVLDAPPPPVDVEVPDSAIGEPAVLDGEQPPLVEIGGVVDAGGDTDAPAVEAPPAEEPATEEPAAVGEPAVLDAPVVGEPISGISGG